MQERFNSPLLIFPACRIVPSCLLPRCSCFVTLAILCVHLAVSRCFDAFPFPSSLRFLKPMSPSVSFPCSWFLCAISLGVLAAGASVPAASIPPVAPVEAPSLITRVVDAFDRWPEVKDDSQLVRIEGVVTGTMPSGSFRLHDGELGLYVTKSPAGRLLTPGDRVLVAGVLRQGGFSPWISPHEVTSLGRGTYPEARSASFGELASGSADNQWVEIEGVVRSVEVLEHRYFVELDLGMTGGNLRVLVNYDPH